MTFYCWRCFAEMPSTLGICGRCGAPQDVDERGYVEKLRAALVHPLAETRRRAIFLLGEKRAAEAIKDLREIIAGEADPFLAEEAATALGKIGDENALDALAAAARHRSFIVRARAVEALAAAGGRWAWLAGELAQHDPSAMVREAAAGGQNPDPKEIP